MSVQDPNIYFTNWLILCKSLQLAKTGLRIVLEVNNRDAKNTSWSAHLICLIVPSPFIIIFAWFIKSEDWGDGFFFSVGCQTALKNYGRVRKIYLNNMLLLPKAKTSLLIVARPRPKITIGMFPFFKTNHFLSWRISVVSE